MQDIEQLLKRKREAQSQIEIWEAKIKLEKQTAFEQEQEILRTKNVNYLTTYQNTQHQVQEKDIESAILEKLGINQTELYLIGGVVFIIIILFILFK